MLIIPAIDIKDKKCVMLKKGLPENQSVYSDDPVAVAVGYERAGVKRIHIIDLDAAFGNPDNFKIIEKIRNAVNIQLQVGGGIREFGKIEKLVSAGFDYVILGTAAVKNPSLAAEAVEKFPGKIIAACDVSGGNVAVDGWREVTKQSASEFMIRMKNAGVGEVIVTDISRDGMLSGLDIALFARIAAETGEDIIVSGGLRDINDISALKKLDNKNIKGVIVGKALYEGKIDLSLALQVASHRPAFCPPKSSHHPPQ